jgi:hypothetical protein
MSSIIRSKKKSCRLLVDDQQQVVQKYNHFKKFLEHNRESLQLIALSARKRLSLGKRARVTG